MQTTSSINSVFSSTCAAVAGVVTGQAVGSALFTFAVDEEVTEGICTSGTCCRAIQFISRAGGTAGWAQEAFGVVRLDLIAAVTGSDGSDTRAIVCALGCSAATSLAGFVGGFEEVALNVLSGESVTFAADWRAISQAAGFTVGWASCAGRGSCVQYVASSKTFTAYKRAGGVESAGFAASTTSLAGSSCSKISSLDTAIAVTGGVGVVGIGGAFYAVGATDEA